MMLNICVAFNLQKKNEICSSNLLDDFMNPCYIALPRGLLINTAMSYRTQIMFHFITVVAVVAGDY